MTQSDSAGKPLTQRRVERTRAEIFDAAIDLFVERGFDATSMEDVAGAAGVSRRTLYRYFDTKDDIVFEPPRQWLEVFERVLADRRDAEPTRDLCRRALLQVATFVAEHPDPVLRAFSVLVSSPALAARHGRSDAEWVQRYLALLGPELAGREHGALEATTAAMALVGAQNALIVVWASSYPDGDVLDLTTRVLDQVDSVWPEPTRHPPAS